MLHSVGLLWRLIVAFILAYPLSGAAYAIVGLAILAFRDPAALAQHPGTDVFVILMWTVLAPMFGGFVPANEADSGPRTNMYPWIVGVTVILFALFSRGWRRIRQTPGPGR